MSFYVLAVFLLAALLPAAFLLRYIYRMDTVEKEPPSLLFSLLLRGCAAALIAAVLEEVGQGLLGAFVQRGSATYIIALAFLVVGAVEEGCKFVLLKRRTWSDPNFNYRFDGVVYAVFVSMGFAGLENVLYVFGYGLSVAVPRALLAIPGHMGFAVFMGAYYGRAKVCEARGDGLGKTVNLWKGYLLAVALHGIYDACTMLGTTTSTVVFALFILAMYFTVFARIRREHNTDTPI